MHLQERKRKREQPVARNICMFAGMICGTDKMDFNTSVQGKLFYKFFFTETHPIICNRLNRFHITMTENMPCNYRAPLTSHMYFTPKHILWCSCSHESNIIRKTIIPPLPHYNIYQTSSKLTLSTKYRFKSMMSKSLLLTAQSYPHIPGSKPHWP